MVFLRVTLGRVCLCGFTTGGEVTTIIISTGVVTDEWPTFPVLKVDDASDDEMVTIPVVPTVTGDLAVYEILAG